MIRDPSIAQPEAVDQSNRLEDRDAGTTYMAWATNPRDDDELLEVCKFLHDTVVDHNHFITFFKARDGSSFDLERLDVGCRRFTESESVFQAQRCSGQTRGKGTSCIILILNEDVE